MRFQGIAIRPVFEKKNNKANCSFLKRDISNIVNPTEAYTLCLSFLHEDCISLLYIANPA
jgi:hypothetical protein